ncbi:hypothetical protein D3C75_1029960 [compost metagenome]
MITATLDAMFPTAAGKAIGENLIKHLIGHPTWAAIWLIHGKLCQLPRRDQRPALRAKPLLTIGPQQFKTVAPYRFPFVQRQAGLIAPQPLYCLRLHDQQPLFIVRLDA